VHTHRVKFTCVQDHDPVNNASKVNPFLAIGAFAQ
jgi:hypothetical protein